VPDVVWKHSRRIIRETARVTDRWEMRSALDALATADNKSGKVSRVIYRQKRDGISRRPRFTSPYSALLSRRRLT